MDVGRWERAAGAAGLAFVVAFLVVEVGLQGGEVGFLRGDGHHADGQVTAYYADDANVSRELASHLVLFYGSLALLAFFAGVGSRLRRVGAPASAAALVIAAGAVAVALLVVGMSLYTGLAFGKAESDAFRVDADVARSFYEAGYAVFMGGVAACAVPVGACSLLALRYGALPRWLAWAGLVVAALLLLAWFYLPLYTLVLWVAAVGIALLAPARAAQPAAVPRPA